MILPIENEGRGNIFLSQLFLSPEICVTILDFLFIKMNDGLCVSRHKCILLSFYGFNCIFKRFFSFEILAFDVF